MSALFLNGVSDDLANSINLGTPKVNSSGGKNIPVFNRVARTGLKMSSPLLLTWGVSENDFDGTGKKTYDMSLQFPSPEYATEESSAFLENLKRLEKYVKDQACANSKAWFGKVQSAEVVEAFWTPMLRYPKDKTTGDSDFTKSPTLRIKLPYWDGAFKFEVFNIHGEIVFPKEDANIVNVIPKGSEVKMILQCGGIWFAGGKFGITWKPFQIVVKPKLQLTQGVCHIVTEDIKKEKRQVNSEVYVSDEEVDMDREYLNAPETETVQADADTLVVESAPSVNEGTEEEVPVKGKKKVKKTT
jgi:hypothetical protein